MARRRGDGSRLGADAIARLKRPALFVLLLTAFIFNLAPIGARPGGLSRAAAGLEQAVLAPCAAATQPGKPPVPNGHRHDLACWLACWSADAEQRALAPHCAGAYEKIPLPIAAQAAFHPPAAAPPRPAGWANSWSSRAPPLFS